MLTLQLATVPMIGIPPMWKPPGAAVLALEEIAPGQPRAPGTRFARVNMPQPGVSLMDAIRSPPGRFHMRVTLEVGGYRVAIAVGPLGDNDTLLLMGGLQVDPVQPNAAPRSLYAGTVVHRMQAGTTGNCEVRCASGQLLAGECCVECTDGDVTVKFCC